METASETVREANHAVFEELSSSPAAMPAGNFADVHGCMPGHVLQTADGIAAYPRAEMKGRVKTWIRIPLHRQPESWKHLGIRDPVISMHGAYPL